MHEEKDHALGLGREMRPPQRIGVRRFGHPEESVVSQQAGQAERSKSASRLAQDGTTGERLGCIPMFEIDQNVLQKLPVDSDQPTETVPAREDLRGLLPNRVSNPLPRRARRSPYPRGTKYIAC